MSQFKVGDLVQLMSIHNTLNFHGGEEGDCAPLVGNIFTVSRIEANVMNLEDDNINYYWHPDDFVGYHGGKKQKIIKKRALCIPKWVKDINLAGRYPEYHKGAAIDYALYIPRRNSKFPYFNGSDVKGHKGNAWINKNHACFASLTSRVFNETDALRLKERIGTDDIWIVLALKYDYPKLNKVFINRWINILKKHNVIPKASKILVNEEINKFRIYMPLIYGTTRTYLALCMIRNLHESPYISVITYDLMKNNNVDFHCAYIMAHWLYKQVHYNHVIYYCCYAGVKPKGIYIEAKKLKKYINEISKEETKFIDRFKTGGGPFNLTKALDSIVITEDVPDDLKYNDLKNKEV